MKAGRTESDAITYIHVYEYIASYVCLRAGDEAPIHCVQRPGEAVFVPDGWPHATINVDDAVGMAWQQYVKGRNDECEIDNKGYLCMLIEFDDAQIAAEQCVPPNPFNTPMTHEP